MLVGLKDFQCSIFERLLALMHDFLHLLQEHPWVVKPQTEESV
jgi:hypothetical protein